MSQAPGWTLFQMTRERPGAAALTNHQHLNIPLKKGGVTVDQRRVGRDPECRRGRKCSPLLSLWLELVDISSAVLRSILKAALFLVTRRRLGRRSALILMGGLPLICASSHLVA